MIIIIIIVVAPQNISDEIRSLFHSDISHQRRTWNKRQKTNGEKQNYTLSPPYKLKPERNETKAVPPVTKTKDSLCPGHFVFAPLNWFNEAKYTISYLKAFCLLSLFSRENGISLLFQPSCRTENLFYSVICVLGILPGHLLCRISN